MYAGGKIGLKGGGGGGGELSKWIIYIPLVSLKVSGNFIYLLPRSAQFEHTVLITGMKARMMHKCIKCLKSVLIGSGCKHPDPTSLLLTFRSSV